MIIWDILHTIFSHTFEIILGAGPFCVFKGMGSGSQSGKLLFKTLGDGKNIVNLDGQKIICQNNFNYGLVGSEVDMCIRDQMIYDASIPAGIVAIGCEKSLFSSHIFGVKEMLPGSNPYIRTISLPGIGYSHDMMLTNYNNQWNCGSLIINGFENSLYLNKHQSKFNNIINSINSKIGEPNKYSLQGSKFDSNIYYSSIISSTGSLINKFTNHSSIIGGKLNKIERSCESAIIGGKCNEISDTNRYSSDQSSRNLILSGYKNSIINSYNIPGPNPTASIEIGNSILSGYDNEIFGGYYNSIVSGMSNFIKGCSSYNNCSGFGNSIISGCSNCIDSYSSYTSEQYGGSRQSIIGGKQNSISTSKYSLILNGLGNQIKSDYSDSTSTCVHASIAIINGYKNNIVQGPNSVIINGKTNKIVTPKTGTNPSTKRSNNAILNGRDNYIYNSDSSVIINNFDNCIFDSRGVSILSGTGSVLATSKYSTISGSRNCMNNTCYSTIISDCACMNLGQASTIIGGFKNRISTFNQSANNSVLGGCSNYIIRRTIKLKNINNSSIIGGYQNTICVNTEIKSSIIVAGTRNILTRSSFSGIIGGYSNQMGATSSNYINPSTYYSTIIGGYCNRIKFGTTDISIKDYKSFHNVIIGGFCNQFECESMISNNVIVGGYKLSGRVLDNNGQTKILCELTQVEYLSLRGSIYVTDNSGNRCKGIASLQVPTNKIINSLCVVKGIIITMSYS